MEAMIEVSLLYYYDLKNRKKEEGNFITIEEGTHAFRDKIIIRLLYVNWTNCI